MKYPIAMGYSLEDWEILEPILRDNNVEIDYELISRTDLFPYLTNNIDNEPNNISNIVDVWVTHYGRKVFEEFDLNIFLDACGIEIEKEISQLPTNINDKIINSELFKALSNKGSLISDKELDDLIDAFLISDILEFLREKTVYRALKGDEMDCSLRQLFIREILKMVS